MDFVWRMNKAADKLFLFILYPAAVIEGTLGALFILLFLLVALMSILGVEWDTNRTDLLFYALYGAMKLSWWIFGILFLGWFVPFVVFKIIWQEQHPGEEYPTPEFDENHNVTYN